MTHNGEDNSVIDHYERNTHNFPLVILHYIDMDCLAIFVSSSRLNNKVQYLLLSRFQFKTYVLYCSYNKVVLLNEFD